jgi:hypothetical protein
MENNLERSRHGKLRYFTTCVQGLAEPFDQDSRLELGTFLPQTQVYRIAATYINLVFGVIFHYPYSVQEKPFYRRFIKRRFCCTLYYYQCHIP